MADETGTGDAHAGAAHRVLAEEDAGRALREAEERIEAGEGRVAGDDGQFGGDGRARHQAMAVEVGDLLIARLLQFGTDFMSDPLHLAAADRDLGLVGERLPGVLERAASGRGPEDLSTTTLAFSPPTPNDT